MKMQKVWIPLAGVAAMLSLGVWTGTALADKPPLSACKPTGQMAMSSLSSTSHSYVQDAPIGADKYFTVSVPTAITINNNCDPNLDYPLDVTVEITDVYVVNPDESSDLLNPNDQEDKPIRNAVVGAFSFTPVSPFLMTSPRGITSQRVDFTVTGSQDIPIGDYLVTIKAHASGVGAATTTFTLIVTEPTDVDTQKPQVAIQSPTPGFSIGVNGTLTFSFTATDPEEDGAGTGITSVAALIESKGFVDSKGIITFHAVSEDITLGVDNDDITSEALSVSPLLPVRAGITVKATAGIQMKAIGSYTLTAAATDDANPPYTGSSAPVSFTVTATKACLPPVSMSGRVFKSGSTIPIKWAFTDANEAFLPPYASIKVKISSPSSTVTAVAGSGANNIRWELDSAGNATQYIVNFPIPATVNDTAYTATIFVQDVDGNEVEQGTCSFVASSKGGKM